jgi:hypothetical protein
MSYEEIKREVVKLAPEQREEVRLILSAMKKAKAGELPASGTQYVPIEEFVRLQEERYGQP